MFQISLRLAQLISCVGLLIVFTCTYQPVHCQYQSTPPSPCPQSFQYQSTGYEVVGVGQIQPGQYQIGADIIMVVHLVVGTQLPSVSK